EIENRRRPCDFLESHRVFCCCTRKVRGLHPHWVHVCGVKRRVSQQTLSQVSEIAVRVTCRCNPLVHLKYVNRSPGDFFFRQHPEHYPRSVPSAYRNKKPAPRLASCSCVLGNDGSCTCCHGFCISKHFNLHESPSLIFASPDVPASRWGNRANTCDSLGSWADMRTPTSWPRWQDQECATGIHVQNKVQSLVSLLSSSLNSSRFLSRLPGCRFTGAPYPRQLLQADQNSLSQPLERLLQRRLPTELFLHQCHRPLRHRNPTSLARSSLGSVGFLAKSYARSADARNRGLRS